jgi:hypothetical protein
LEADVAIQAGIGRFFAEKLRAGALFELYRATGDGRPVQEALAAYRRARQAWLDASAVSQATYKRDITYGRAAHLRGCWQDRLAAIDQDIADMEAEQVSKTARPAGVHSAGQVTSALQAILSRDRRPVTKLLHTPPASFRKGAPIVITARPSSRSDAGKLTLRLHYRRVNQADVYQIAEMAQNGDEYTASIPRANTDSPFPVQYFFEVRRGSGAATLWPGFNAELTNPPYFVVRQG